MFKQFLTYAREWFKVNRWQAITLAAIVATAFFFAGSVFAAEATLTCVPPTKNTDGSNITGALSYKAYIGTSAGAFTLSADMQSSCSGKISLPNPAAGQSLTYFIAETAIANGLESAKSNSVSVVVHVDFPTPNPPTGVTAVVTQTTAYDVRFQLKHGKLVAALGKPVGTIALGTECSDKFAVEGGYQMVDRKQVDSRARVLPAVIVAKCGQA